MQPAKSWCALRGHSLVYDDGIREQTAKRRDAPGRSGYAVGSPRRLLKVFFYVLASERNEAAAGWELALFSGII